MTAAEIEHALRGMAGALAVAQRAGPVGAALLDTLAGDLRRVAAEVAATAAGMRAEAVKEEDDDGSERRRAPQA